MSNYWGGYVLLDPSDMEKMFSQEDSWENLPSVWEEIQESSLLDLERVRDLLDFLPPREADFIELYFFKRVRQTAIADLFNVSQPTVCYRLQKGAARLRYLVEMPLFNLEEMERDLRKVVTDERDLRIMLGMVRTTCQSDVARELNASQGFVRHRFLRTISKMEKVGGMETYVEVFRKIEKNLNILKNTSKAMWAEEVIHSVC